MLSVVMLSVVMLSVVMLSVASSFLPKSCLDQVFHFKLGSFSVPKFVQSHAHA